MRRTTNKFSLFVEHLKKGLEQDKIRDVLDTISLIFEHHEKNQSSNLLGQLTAIQNDYIGGLMNLEERALRRNRLRDSTVKLIDKIKNWPKENITKDILDKIERIDNVTTIREKRPFIIYWLLILLLGVGIFGSIIYINELKDIINQLETKITINENDSNEGEKPSTTNKPEKKRNNQILFEQEKTKKRHNAITKKLIQRLAKLEKDSIEKTIIIESLNSKVKTHKQDSTENQNSICNIYSNDLTVKMRGDKNRGNEIAEKIKKKCPILNDDNFLFDSYIGSPSSKIKIIYPHGLKDFAFDIGKEIYGTLEFRPSKKNDKLLSSQIRILLDK